MATYDTAQAALAELQKNPSKYKTLESLQILASEVSSYSEGKVTVLYSGADEDVLSAIKANPDARMIGKTQASKFLGEDDFIKAVAKAMGEDVKTYGDRNTPLNEIFNGTREGDFWNELSRRFVQETKGPTFSVTNTAPDNRIWAKTELFEALKNPDIPELEGIPKDTLLQARNDLVQTGRYATTDDATDAIRAKISAQADHNIRSSQIGFDAEGKPAWFETSKFTNGLLPDAPQTKVATLQSAAENLDNKIEKDLASDNPKVRERALERQAIASNNPRLNVENAESLHTLPQTAERQAVIQAMAHQGSTKGIYTTESQSLKIATTDLTNPQIQKLGGLNRTDLAAMSDELIAQHGYTPAKALEAVNARVTVNTALDELKSGRIPSLTDELAHSQAVLRQTATVLSDSPLATDLNRQVVAGNNLMNHSPVLAVQTLEVKPQSITQPTPFQQALKQTQLDPAPIPTTSHKVLDKHISAVEINEYKHITEHAQTQKAETAAKQIAKTAELKTLTQTTEAIKPIHIEASHPSKGLNLGKGVGIAGVVIEAGLGAVEVNQAIKQANSTREQYVAGFEAGGNAAVKSAVTGVAGLGGGIVGGAGGAITPVPGGAAIGAIGVGGAAAYGAGELYEDSASQRAVKAVSRGAGEFAYDHISKEGRLAGDIRELKEQISQTSDPAKTRALNEQLNQTTQAFNVEADKNQRQIDAQKLSDQHFQDLRKEYPRLNQGVVNVELENAIKQGNSPQKALELAVNAGLKHSAYEPVVLADKLKEYGNNAQVEARNSTDTYKESRGGNPTAAQTANLDRERHTEFKTNYVSIAQAFERDMSAQATRVRVAEANQYVKAIGKTNFVETYPGSREFPQAAKDLMAKMDKPQTYRPVQPPQGLHQGAQGKKVENLQNALNLLGADVAVDGHFGKDTTQALKAFQKAHHLKVDGELDLKTHQVMMNAVKQTTVKHVQTTLNELGADLTINGRMDKATVAAVKDFQIEHQLKPTGKLDGLTTEAMAQAVQQQTQQNVSQQRPTAVQEPSVQTTQPISISPEQQPQIDRMLAVMAQNPALAGLSREEQTTMAMGLINAAVDTPAPTQSAQVTPVETLAVPQSQSNVASQAATSAAVTTEAPVSLNKVQQGHVDQILGLMAEKPEFKAFNPEQQKQMAMGLMIEAHQRGEPMDKLQGIYLPQNGQTLAAQFDTPIGMVHLPAADALKTTPQQLVEAHNPQVSQQQVLQQQLQQSQSTRDPIDVQGVSMPRSNMPIEFAATASLSRTQQGHVDRILERMAENPAFAIYPAEQRTQMAMGLMVEAAKRGEPMDKLQGVYLPQNGQTLAAQFDTPIGIVHLPTQEALQTAPQDVTIAQNNQVVQQQQQEQQRAVEREQSQGRGMSLG